MVIKIMASERAKAIFLRPMKSMLMPGLMNCMYFSFVVVSAKGGILSFGSTMVARDARVRY
jgi:hypothetical protein